MLSNLIEDWARGIARGVARLFAKSPLTPNSLTVIGFLMNIPVAYVLANGWFFLAGFLILFAGIFDMLDGALAKVTGRATKFGAFLDSTLDRYGEVLLFLGLLLYYRGFPEADKDGGSILVYAAITGSLMISYAKARAEGLGMECKMGLLPRPERIVIIAAGCLLFPAFSGSIIVALWILAIGTNLTAWQRILYIWYKTSKTEAESRNSVTISADIKLELKSNKPKEHQVKREIPLDEETGEPLRKRWSFRRVDH